MALKSGTLSQDTPMFEKRGKAPPYVNLESAPSSESLREGKRRSPHKIITLFAFAAHCPPGTSADGAGGPIDGKGKSNRSYEGLATTSADGVRFRQHPPEQCVGMAVFDYEAREQDELTLKRGSMMKIVEEECGEEGWALARMGWERDGTRVGKVPKHYVALLGSQPEMVEKDSVRRSDEFLGAGSYAEVFRGTYKGKQVALKLPRAENGEALKREALILSRLRHENIVQFFGISPDPLFIVLELCEGGNLFSLYRKMSSSEVLTVIFWAKQVASAIEHLHARDEPLVYADMKAENVLIKQKPCDDGQCRKCKKMCINRLTLKLADFNVTRHIGVKRDSCSGSLPWKSPEMENANAHPSMDIWSFGTFFWELLSRKVPNWVSIYIWINKKTKGPPLPLPEDLPPELRRVFDGCWRREISERPSIVQVRAQLEEAEQSVDNNYKWLLREDAQCESSLSVGDGQLDPPTLEDALDSQTNAAVQSSINISAHEVLMLIERFGKKGKKPSKVERMWASWFQPPEARRQKRLAKLDKHSIGAPIDFRHIVSAKVRERADDFGDKPMVIRYANAELPPLQRQQSHRSHDSLLECGREGTEGDGRCASAGGYSTLPRTFKHQQQSRSSADETNLLPPPVPRRACCRSYPWCSKLGMPKATKSAKSNPELKNLGILCPKSGGKVFPAAMGGRGGGQNCHKSPQPIGRRHDYLTLLPSGASLQQTNLCQKHRPPIGLNASEDCPLRKDRAEPAWVDGSSSSLSGEDFIRQYVNVPNGTQKAARRNNAVRQRVVADASAISESSECSSNVTTPNGGGAEGESSSSADLVAILAAGDGGETALALESGRAGTANPSRHKSNRIKGNKHQQELSELFNRRVSPPQPHSLSPSTASGGAPIQLRRATFGELDKARRGELGHSTFYVDELDSPPEGSNSTVEELGGGGRRRSTTSNGGIHRSIASYLFKPLIGTKSSSRVDELLEPEAAAVSIGVTFACCFHPHHGTNVAHLCALSSVLQLEFKLSLAPGQLDSKPTEFVRELRSVSVERTPQRHAQHNLQNARFIKRADYPENQARQRHRTESAATAAQLPQRRLHLNSVAGGRSPTSSETGRQRRVSSSLMDTVIELQQISPSVNDNLRLSSATPRPPGVSILNSTIPMHLNRNGPLIPPQNPSMLSPGRALPNWHQRSRSSDSAAGKPLSNELAELLSLQPVPVDGSIANPSYVPMQENENNAKLLVPTTKVTHSAPPRQLQAEPSKRPVPKPRTAKADDLAQFPTSQAPMLNRAEIAAASNCSQNAVKDFSMPVSEQCRPNTLRLAPSGRHSDATNASAVGESSGCDSGMCVSSSNEGENSPQTPVPTKNGSATLFPSAPNALPTVVSIAESPAQNLRSTNGNAFNRFRPPPPPHFTPPFEVVPPPVPPKQHQKEGGPRVPPLPRNRRVLRQ
uniref:mitogen-activated protein kinase kinase kinase n=1 Tax=Globodera rostochiensis TaxID=31243 RepID=A0A914HF87_GLORO